MWPLHTVAAHAWHLLVMKGSACEGKQHTGADAQCIEAIGSSAESNCPGPRTASPPRVARLIAKHGPIKMKPRHPFYVCVRTCVRAPQSTSPPSVRACMRAPSPSICACVRPAPPSVRVCVCAQPSIYACVHQCLRAWVCPCAQPLNLCMRACISACVRPAPRPVRLCVHQCVRACAQPFNLCMRACMRACNEQRRALSSLTYACVPACVQRGKAQLPSGCSSASAWET
jgi:hypothetical protein